MRLFLLSLILWCQCALAQFGGVQQPMFSMLESSSPIPTGNLVAWHKPETLTGTNGQGLTSWLDSTAYQHDGTNYSGNVYLVLNAIDSKSAVAFGAGGAGGGSYFTWTNNNGMQMLNNIAGASFYAVICLTNAADSDVFYLSAGASSTKGRFAFTDYAATLLRFWALSVDSDVASGGYANLSIDFPLSTWFLLDGVADYPGRVHTAYTNGAQLVTHSDTFTASNTSNTDSVIARFGGGWNAPYRGYIAEFLLYTTNHDVATRRLIETNYFKVKYPSIPIN